jgi:hypothetical protein
MESLSASRRLGFSVVCFFWSGVPLGFATRAAAKDLVALLERLDNRPLAIWCKSTGADVVNLAARRIRPDLVLQVAPTYAASVELETLVRRVTVRLEHDSFLAFWEKARVVHQLNGAHENEYVIVGPPNIGHHELNYPVEVALSTGRSLSLYSLYEEILSSAVE